MFSIRTRFFLFFCLLAILPVMGLGILISFQTENILEQRVTREMRLEVVTAAETVETYLNGVRRDLFSLSRFLERRMPIDRSENRWRELSEEFYKVIEAESSYYQIRFIGTDGWEKLRINNYSGHLVPVPPEEHQYKGERYYFREALKLAPGELYLSPLDYNIEHGRIEDPKQLVTRMATPVADPNGEIQGIVIINIFGDDLLKMLEAVPPVGGAKLFLVGGTDYVERFRVEKSIEVRIGDADALSERLNVSLNELPETPQTQIIHRDRALVALAPIAAGDSQWLLVKTFPRSLLEEDLQRIQRAIAIFALALLCLAAVLAVVAARSFIRPIDKVIHFADAIAGGDFERQVHHPGRDEFGHLTATLNRMAADLASSHKRLIDWNQSLQREVDHRTQDLKAAKEAAENANRAKDQFLDNMSHELRTPMTVFLGMMELLDGTRLDSEQRNYIEKANESGEALLRIIEEILDQSSIERGLLRLEEEPFEVAACLKSVVEVFRPQAEAKNLNLKLNLGSNLPQRIVGDARRLRQVLNNLIGNAIKFSERGTITLGASLVPNSMIRFEVEDSGCGIPAEKIGMIFGRFYQADASLTRRYGGTGLGLSISKHVVESMGGTLEVESEEGQGSRFFFSVPLRVPEENAELTPSQADSEGQASAKRARILIVEDDAQVQKLLDLILRSMGWEVVSSDNGDEAVEVWNREAIDLILMDIQMPVMNGLEATRLIRERERKTGTHIPIIGLTAHAREEDRRACLDAGMDDWLSKPIDRSKLFKTITEHLGKDQ